MKKAALIYFGQLLEFYEAFQKLGEHFPRAYYPDEEEEDLMGTKDFVPTSFYDINFADVTYEFEYEFEAGNVLKESLKALVTRLESEYKSRNEKDKDISFDYLSFPVILTDAVKAYEAYCKIGSRFHYRYELQKCIFDAAANYDGTHTLCLLSGDDIDKLLHALEPILNNAAFSSFGDYGKVHNYLKLIDKIESCPEGPGIIKALELALDATPTTEEEE